MRLPLDVFFINHLYIIKGYSFDIFNIFFYISRIVKESVIEGKLNRLAKNTVNPLVKALFT